VKRILIAACIAALPVAARGQVTQTGSPAPKAPTTEASSSSFVFRVGGFVVNGQRNYAFNNTQQSGTGSLKGVDVLLRGAGVGLAVRSLTGSFTTSSACTASGCSSASGTQPDVTSADASVLFGPPAFTVWIGGSKRALTDTSIGVTQVYTFARVGAQMSFVIGGSGLTGQVGAWGYAPSDPKIMKLGGEGEGSIIYSPPHIPFYLQLGYRTEVFTAKTLTTETPEEVRGLRLGGGIQFGGK
jgi:hypothetical protein